MLMLKLEMPALRIAQRRARTDVSAIFAELVYAFIIRQEIGFEIALEIPRLPRVLGDEPAFVFKVQAEPEITFGEIIELVVRVDVFRRQDAQRLKQAELGAHAKAVVIG